MRVSMSELIVFDRSVLVDDLRTGCHQERMAAVAGLVRTSAVVLAEVWGARKPPEREFLRVLQRNHPVLCPTAGN